MLKEYTPKHVLEPVDTGRPITVSSILGATGHYYGFTDEQLLAKSRDEPGIVEARGVVAILMSDHADLSDTQIATTIDRPRATVTGSIQNIRQRALQEPKVQRHLRELARAAAGESLETTLSTWKNLVSDHYDLPPEEMRSSQSPAALEARQVVAYLLAQKTILKNSDIARHAGLSASSKVKAAIKSVLAKTTVDQYFAEDLQQLEAGKLPDRLTPEDFLDKVANFYGISREELTGASTKQHLLRPRLMAMYLIARRTRSSYTETGKWFGKGSSVRDKVIGFEKALETNPVLAREEEYILDPESPTKEQIIKQDMQKVCDLYGVKLEEVTEDRPSDRFLRPRKVIAYLLYKKHGLSFEELGGLLNRHTAAARLAYHNVREELDENGYIAEEIEYLEHSEDVKFNINDRVIQLVSELMRVNTESMFNPQNSDEKRARQIAISLLAERGHLSSREVAELFGMKTHDMTHRAVKEIEYRRTRDSLLTQQLQWVRQQVFAETHQPFQFDDGMRELIEDQEVDLRNRLPDISPDLASPEIIKEVYGIVETVADFYNLEPADLLSRKREFTINRARKLALLLCSQARIPTAEVALCFDNRSVEIISRLVNACEQDLEKDSIFSQELEDLSSGEMRKDLVGQTLGAVLKYFDITFAELCRSKTPWESKARSTFLIVVQEYGVASHRQLAKLLGITGGEISFFATNAKERLDKDPRFAAEVNYIRDPKNAVRPPMPDDVIKKIMDSMDISKDKLQNPQTADEHKAQRTAAYILFEEVGLPYKKIAAALEVPDTTISGCIRTVRQEINRDPRAALFIDRLKPAYSVTISKTSYIVFLVAKRFNVSLDELVMADSTPILDQARSVARVLLKEKTDQSDETISKLLGKQLEQKETADKLAA